MLRQKIADIETQARAEGRSLYEVEKGLISEMKKEADHAEMSLPQRALTQPGPVSMGGARSTGPFSSFGEQLTAVMRAGLPNGPTDQRLRNAATGLGETVSSDGGFLVQQDFTDQLLIEVMQTGLLAKKCLKIPISANSNSLKLNAYDESSRASTRFGGVLSYWKDEAAEKTASKPKFRQIELTLKKLIGLCYSSDELLADATALEAVIKRAFVSEFGFQIDDAIVNGTGAGMPLGILNAGCLVSVGKETGQAAATVVAENVIKMISRTLGPTSGYAWLHSKTTLPQIYSLSLAVGTAGIPLFMAGGSIPNQPENRLLGLPLIECEQCQVLGTVGDLILADLGNGYILAEKDGIQSDVSIHVRFVWDESTFRFVLRCDGCPVRASALTPYKGGASNTQSHFVALATRS
ncbi:MAG: phage major capsid protein [Proteobacteria bacterium]|nr:phage major capsid protein [Pseudomonadota bacterium]